MGKWLGKTINPLGTYSGFYFNKSFTLGEVFEILKQLPYKEIFGAPAYTIFNGHDSNNNYILVLAVSEPQSRWYEIHITKRYNGEIKMYNIRPSSLENEYFDFGFEVTGTLDAEDYNNGEEKYNDLIKTYVSAVPIRYDNSFAIQMHPINEDGSLDKTINLFPKTRMSAIEDGDGNPVEETELELSDAEPSENAKELKKVLMNGTEWKVTGSGGGDVLELKPSTLDEIINLDDATIEKLVNKKITRIRIISKVHYEDFNSDIDVNLDFDLNSHITFGEDILVYISIVPLINFDFYLILFSPETKQLQVNSTPVRLIETCRVDSKEFQQSSSTSASVSLADATITDGQLAIKLNFDGENLENDYYIPSTKAVKNYVDSKIEQSVTSALSDDYTIGG